MKITVASQNLFEVALQYLGDATLWIQIAEVNDVSDPWLSGLVTLEIPDHVASLGGRIVRH